MHLSAARAEITPEDLNDWARKIETILAKPEYAGILEDPTRVFNNVTRPGVDKVKPKVWVKYSL